MTHASATQETRTSRRAATGRVATSGPVTSRLATSGLAASREAALCGKEGLEAVFRRAVEAGAAPRCDSVEAWLEAIVEGRAEDMLGESGWRPCRAARRCLRAGRCLGRRGNGQ